MIFTKTAIGMVILGFALTLGCSACSTQDASDPTYGQMFKQTTRDRVAGTGLWESRTQKDCGGGGEIQVCRPLETNASTSD